MKITRYVPSANPPENAFEKDLDRSLDRIFATLFEILNNGLSFTDNFDSYMIEVTTDATPGVETAITHGLKRIPVGMLVLEKDQAAHVFKGPSGKDISTYYIQSDLPSVKATVLIF